MALGFGFDHLLVNGIEYWVPGKPPPAAEQPADEVANQDYHTKFRQSSGPPPALPWATRAHAHSALRHPAEAR